MSIFQIPQIGVRLTGNLLAADPAFLVRMDTLIFASETLNTSFTDGVATAIAVGQFGVSQTFSLHFPGGFRFRPRIRCQIPWEVVNAADGGTTGRIELGYLLDTTPIVDGSGNPVRSVGETRALDAAPGTLYTELLLADLDQEVVAAGGSELRVSVELFVVVSGGAGTADFRLNHDPAVPVDRMVVEVDTGE